MFANFRILTYDLGMPRFVLIVLTIGLSVYALADCLQTPNPKALPKLVWIAIIVLIPVIGPLLWILFGRTNGRGWGRGDDDVFAPDDDPSFLRDLSPKR
jgi:drug/metabolite transporter (DMT)-like permease